MPGQILNMTKKIYVGTSGYNYAHWINKFYPKDIPQKMRLEFYTQHFNSVELNVTFYRLPKDTVFQNWYKRTPSDFRFVIKGSRFITHIKRLKDVGEPLKLFMQRAAHLKNKLTCVLWQTPPNLSYDASRIKSFIKHLKKWPRYLYSFEFRNESWFNEELYDMLKGNNINLCTADSPSYPYKEILTSNFIYLRFHGEKKLYGSKYSPSELKKWEGKSAMWMKDRNILFAFFNNDAYGFAVENALYFQKLLGKWKTTN